MIVSAIPTLVLIGLAAVLAPLTAEALRRFVPVPEVVILILFGIVLGPSVLGLAHTNTIVTALSDFGLTFLMFLAGTELDLATMREGHLGRAAISWAASLVIALAVGVASMRRASFSAPSWWPFAWRRQRSGPCCRFCAMQGRFERHWAAPSCRSGRSGSSARSWRSPSCSRTVTPH